MDTRQKRAAVLGVARPWYRNAHPAAIDEKKRAAVGNTYPLAFFLSVLETSNSARHRIVVKARRFKLWVR